MKILRSTAMYLALALGSMLSLTAHAVEHVILRPVGSLLTAGANTMAKFNADLAQAMATREEVAKVDSSLQRDSHGFRQDTAANRAPVFFPGTKMVLAGAGHGIC